MAMLEQQDSYTPSDSEFKKIQEFINDDTIKKENIFCIKRRACGNKEDTDNEIFSEKALKTMAKTLVDTPSLTDHRFSSDSMWGKNYSAKVVNDSTQKGYWGKPNDPEYKYVEVMQYTVRTDSNEDDLAMIKAGVKDKVSVGFMWSVDDYKCSICGNGIYERDEEGRYLCIHIPGMKYGKDKCTAIYNDILKGYDLSDVPLGAQEDAGTIKSFDHNKTVGKEYNLDDTVIDYKAWKSGLNKKFIQNKMKQLEENIVDEAQLNEKLKDYVQLTDAEEKIKVSTEGVKDELVKVIDEVKQSFEEMKNMDFSEKSLKAVDELRISIEEKMTSLEITLKELKDEQVKLQTTQEELKKQNTSDAPAQDPNVVFGKVFKNQEDAQDVKDTFNNLIV